jgi:two-component sensor histidine kinase
MIKFPCSADTLRINQIRAPKTLEISELNGLPATFTEWANSFARFFRDQEKQPEIVKYFFVILLLVLYNLKLRKNIRNIAVIRWVTTVFIFIAFAFVNHFFLFQWFSVSFFIPPGMVLGLLTIEYLVIDRILFRRLADKEKLDLREKLSRDLHDELASTLGSISIYAETLKGMKESSSESGKLPVKIAGLTQSALQSVSEIIWMTSPRNDSLQSLISKTSNYMLEILTDNKINFRSSIEIQDEPVTLPEQVRNDIYLILKEGLHNIIRHAGAGTVEFNARQTSTICSISLKDDGTGIAPSTEVKKGSHGNGLVNMRRRALESGIEFNIISGEGTGTEIVLHFKI